MTVSVKQVLRGGRLILVLKLDQNALEWRAVGAEKVTSVDMAALN